MMIGFIAPVIIKLGLFRAERQASRSSYFNPAEISLRNTLS